MSHILPGSPFISWYCGVTTSVGSIHGTTQPVTTRPARWSDHTRLYWRTYEDYKLYIAVFLVIIFTPSYSSLPRTSTGDYGLKLWISDVVFRNFSASCSVNFVAKYLCTCYKLQAHNDNGNDNKSFAGKWLNNNLLVFRSWCKRGKRRFLYTSANNKYCCAHQILLPTFCQIFFIDTNPGAYLNRDKYHCW